MKLENNLYYTTVHLTSAHLCSISCSTDGVVAFTRPWEKDGSMTVEVTKIDSVELSSVGHSETEVGYL